MRCCKSRTNHNRGARGSKIIDQREAKQKGTEERRSRARNKIDGQPTSGKRRVRRGFGGGRGRRQITLQFLL